MIFLNLWKLSSAAQSLYKEDKEEKKRGKKPPKPHSFHGCDSAGCSFLPYQYFRMTHGLNRSPGVESSFGNCKFTLHYKRADYSKQMNWVNKISLLSSPLWLVFWYRYYCFYYSYYCEAAADSSAWNPLFIFITTSAVLRAKRHWPEDL